MAKKKNELDEVAEATLELTSEVPGMAEDPPMETPLEYSENIPPASEPSAFPEEDSSYSFTSSEPLPPQPADPLDDTEGELGETAKEEEPQFPEEVAETPLAEGPMPQTEPGQALAAPEQDLAPKKTFYQLDFHELDRGLSPEERQEWNSIYASYRGRSALTCQIIGVDRYYVNVQNNATGEMEQKEMYCAVVIPFRTRILIPETEMWPKGGERPSYVLRNMVGASIDLIVIHVDREGGFAIGSRKQALSSRRYYFSTQPGMNKVGARVQCRVLSVGPRRCLVSCFGYDVDLTQREMRYTAIPDLRDEYHPGQELDCIVKGYDREAGTLSLSVKETMPNPFDGAEQRHPLGSRRQAVIAGKYAGGIFCNLPDGAVCMCSYSYQYEDSAFAIGDRVILVIQRYDDGKKQIYGKILAKW